MYINEDECQKQDGIILDIRSKDEYDNLHLSLSHIHIPMHEIDLKRFITEQDRPLFILCHVGGRAAQLANILIQSGLTDTKVIEGGILACTQVKGPNSMSDEHIHSFAGPSFQGFVARNS